MALVVKMEIRLDGEAKDLYRAWLREMCPGQFGEESVRTELSVADDMELGVEADLRTFFFEVLHYEKSHSDPGISVRTVEIDYNG
jgi:hypothetical protein